MLDLDRERQNITGHRNYISLKKWSLNIMGCLRPGHWKDYTEIAGLKALIQG